MQMNVLDYFDFERVNTLLEAFNKTTGFVTAILDFDGKILSQSGWREICVEFHRKNPETLINCRISDTELANKIEKTGNYHFYKCMNGLVDVVIPIVVNGEHIANLFSGQFFFEEPDIPFFKKQAQLYGFDEISYIKALGKVPVVSKEKVEVAMNFLRLLTQLIIDITAEKSEQIELNKLIKKNEIKLLESQAQLQQNMNELLESQRIAHLGTWRLDLTTNQVVWSEELYKLYGLDPQFPPPPYTEHMKLFTPESWEKLSIALETTRTSGIPYELELETVVNDDSNGWMWVRGEAEINPEGKITALFGAAQDITQKKGIEEELRRERDRARIYFDTADVIFLVINRDGIVTAINKKGCEILGYTEKDILGKSWFDTFISQSNRLEVTNVFNKIVYGELNSLKFYENTVVNAKGEERIISWHNNIIKDEAGYISDVLSAGNDVTERKKAEEVLAESEDKFKYVFENSPVAKSLTSISGEIDVNQAFCKMLGYTKKELSGGKWQSITHPEDVKVSKEAIDELINGNKQLAVFQKRYVKKDGTIVWGEVHTSIRRDKEGNPLYFMTVIIDITEKIKLEEQRILMESQQREQQKLEAIGTLASGVAHEINNPINGIMNYGQIIADSELNDEKIKNYAKEIILESQRISTIVRNLLDFSRQNGDTHSKARIDDIIESALSLLRTGIKKDQITLKVNIESDLPELYCRSQQIQQVLMNLMTNAKDALNSRYPQYNENKVINLVCSQCNSSGNQWLKVIVEDFGTGISDKIKDRIFDPFFTTKDKDQGTGLGLSISYGIIREHHGEMFVESEEGNYTRFIINLPCESTGEIESSNS